MKKREQEAFIALVECMYEFIVKQPPGVPLGTMSSQFQSNTLGDVLEGIRSLSNEGRVYLDPPCKTKGGIESWDFDRQRIYLHRRSHVTSTQDR